MLWLIKNFENLDAPLEEFHPAEEYHQNFLVRNRTYPYVVVNDLPKLDRLRQEFPKLVK